ncbi:mycolic acid cyclopropane synthetase family protein [Mycobacterium intracellulare 1956]|uniref:Mycolic acid cyclopropane synthetase family protein n=1 Tax=Mycobacterium intracellulare 1956 TaxID=1299331 RepID=X8CKE3_MYCIT|nr:mycolic acid cyclopropane synthetase family protein [Mycobacterium intracellulare 1956]
MNARAMSIDQKPSDPSTYVLGHVDAEIRRLLLQGSLHNDFTEHVLRLAGLRPGMRVLDVGCGPGDVSFIAARLVGQQGAVLGVDAAADVVRLARSRAAQQGLRTIRFEATAITDIRLDRPVDAVIGRLILMHLPDPSPRCVTWRRWCVPVASSYSANPISTGFTAWPNCRCGGP